VNGNASRARAKTDRLEAVGLNGGSEAAKGSKLTPAEPSA